MIVFQGAADARRTRLSRRLTSTRASLSTEPMAAPTALAQWPQRISEIWKLII
jgi:hypothetical protein